MKKVFLILFMLGCYSITLSAQQFRRNLADKYFKMLDYYEASVIYDDLAKMTLKTKNEKKKDWDAVRRAAETHRLVGDYTKSEDWYTKLNESGQMNDKDRMNYIEVLRYNGKYTEAQQQVNELSKKGYSSEILNDYAANTNYVNELKSDSIRIKIKEAEFNSGWGDFAPQYTQVDGKEALVYASKRRNTGFLRGKYGWDNQNYIDCYIVKSKDAGKHIYEKKSKLLKKKFKTGVHDGPVVFSKDGNMAIITRNESVKSSQGDIIHLGLYVIKKDAKGKWGKPEAFAYNNKEYSVGHASLSADGSTMYFASDMPGGVGGVDIYKSVYSNGSWSEPENLGHPINTEGDEMFPYISQQGKLFFASNGHVGLGGLDVFESEGDNGNFTYVENMGYPLNSNHDDFGLVTDSTDEFGFLTSNRKDNTDRIYKADIKWPVFEVSGLVVDNDGKKTPIKNTEVTIRNKNTGETQTVMTDENGRFDVKLHPHTDYEFTSKNDEYTPLNTGTATTKGRTESSTIPVELMMEKQNIAFKGVVIDKETKKTLPNTKVTIVDEQTGKTYDLMSNDSGLVEVVLPRKHDFDVSCHHKGYTDLSAEFDTKVYSEEVKELPLEMLKFHKGDVFAVKDIYYDYDKATLRDSSKIELDKLATFLIENSNIKVELGSHTDSRGGDKYNQTLSQKRAQSAVDYLISKGVKQENIVAKGYGETKLVNRCKNGVQCSEEEHQQNRRTEIRILKVSAE